MNENDFEGSIVLEQLAAIGKLDEFYQAVDSDDVSGAVHLMKMARVDSATMAVVVQKMESADGQH